MTVEEVLERTIIRFPKRIDVKRTQWLLEHLGNTLKADVYYEVLQGYAVIPPREWQDGVRTTYHKDWR